MAILIIFITSFLLRLYFMSPWLADWDSVQFSMALHKFSIAQHLPQPPGYIIYVFLGRLINLVFKNDTLSLTLLSAILGSSFLIIFYFLARSISNKVPAGISTILISIIPVHVLSSITVLSDIPGEFFAILSALFLYKGRLSRRFLLIGSLLAGISLGVRFAEFSTVISLLILVLFFRKSFLDLVRSIIYFLVGTLIWLIPLIMTTGWVDFVKSYDVQANYIIKHDSLINYSLSLTSRFIQLWKLFLLGYTSFFIPFIIFVIFYFVKNKALVKKFNSIFVLVWLFSYLTPLVLVYNLEVTRFVLPLLAPLALLFAITARDIIRNKIFLLFFASLAIPIFTVSYNEAYKTKNLVPPTIAPVLYVKNNFSSDNTVLITSFTFRQFQYYASNFQNYLSEEPGTPKFITSSYLIIDYDGIKDRIENIDEYKFIDQKTFEGPREIFPRISKTNLYIYKKI